MKIINNLNLNNFDNTLNYVFFIKYNNIDRIKYRLFVDVFTLPLNIKHCYRILANILLKNLNYNKDLQKNYSYFGHNNVNDRLFIKSSENNEFLFNEISDNILYKYKEISTNKKLNYCINIGLIEYIKFLNIFYLNYKLYKQKQEPFTIYPGNFERLYLYYTNDYNDTKEYEKLFYDNIYILTEEYTK